MLMSWSSFLQISLLQTYASVWDVFMCVNWRCVSVLYFIVLPDIKLYSNSPQDIMSLSPVNNAASCLMHYLTRANFFFSSQHPQQFNKPMPTAFVPVTQVIWGKVQGRSCFTLNTITVILQGVFLWSVSIQCRSYKPHQGLHFDFTVCVRRRPHRDLS